MVKTEYYKTRSDGVKLYRTYSTDGYCLRQKETGNVYGEAIDVDGASYTYEEAPEFGVMENREENML